MRHLCTQGRYVACLGSQFAMLHPSHEPRQSYAIVSPEHSTKLYRDGKGTAGRDHILTQEKRRESHFIWSMQVVSLKKLSKHSRVTVHQYKVQTMEQGMLKTDVPSRIGRSSRQ